MSASVKLFANIVVGAMLVLLLGAILFLMVEGISIVIEYFTGVDIQEESRKKFAEWRGRDD